MESSSQYKNKNFYYNSELCVFDYIKLSSQIYLKNKALSYRQYSYTYKELISISYNVASQLKKYGLMKGDRIAINIEISHKMVILIIACLLSGYCYIPIDKSYPIERINTILSESYPKFLISDKNNTHLTNIGFIDLDKISFDIDFDYINLSYLNKINGNDPAYIIYTSGSTGRPKGIEISHKSINNHMLWMAEQFLLSSSDVFLLRTPIAFDPSVWETLLPFYIGANLIVHDSLYHADTKKLSDNINKYKVTVLQLTPAILNNFLKFEDRLKNKSLRYIFSGGESLSAQTKKLFFKNYSNCKLINLYGPAEATIDTTFHEVKNNNRHLYSDIIGKPIKNTQLYVKNKQGNLCKINETGELFISGENLAIGYVNNNQTKKSFIYYKLFSGQRVYKTGDLVKWNEFHELEYIGRKDNQIKINGVRIETDELKIFFQKNTSIYDCYFDIYHDKINQFKNLICYFIKDKNYEIDMNNLMTKLKSTFPSYMIPAKFYYVNKTDITNNGKVNLIKVNNTSNIGYIDKIALSNTEKKLIECWNSVLPNKINNILDDFFHFGGTSILACTLAYIISDEFHINFEMGHLISYRSIKEQAQYIDGIIMQPRNKCIVRLNDFSSKKLFLIHPIGGTVFWYIPLAKILSGNIQIYGISDPELCENGKPLNNIIEMAQYYCELILSVQNHGPYCLGGASFGATVSIEVARLLVKKGHKVTSIFIFDGWAVYPNDLKDEHYFSTSMLRQQKNWITEFNQLGFSKEKYSNLFKVQNKRLKMLFKYKISSF